MVHKRNTRKKKTKTKKKKKKTKQKPVYSLAVEEEKQPVSSTVSKMGCWVKPPKINKSKYICPQRRFGKFTPSERIPDALVEIIIQSKIRTEERGWGSDSSDEWTTQRRDTL